MNNSRLYWWVLVAMWSVAIGVVSGILRAEWLAVVPVVMVVLALRCVLRPDWRRGQGRGRSGREAGL
jgi:uncharacterized membrane protein YfcA